MSTEVTVSRGDCISSLSKQNGFLSIDTIYGHASNAKLKGDRPNPNVLAQDDKVVIPDKAEKEESGSTDARLRLKLKSLKTTLGLQLQDDSGSVPSISKCKLTIDKKTLFEGALPADGKLEVAIEADSKEGELALTLSTADGVDPLLIKLELGALEHESTLSGVQARLENLGYDCGGISGTEDDKTKVAVAAFKRKNGLAKDNKIDAATRTQLRKSHEGV
jgi:hypothetical protein